MLVEQFEQEYHGEVERAHHAGVPLDDQMLPQHPPEQLAKGDDEAGGQPHRAIASTPAAQAGLASLYPHTPLPAALAPASRAASRASARHGGGPQQAFSQRLGKTAAPAR